MSLPWREDWCRWAVRQRLNLYSRAQMEIKAEMPQEGMHLGYSVNSFFLHLPSLRVPCIRSQCTATTFPFHIILATTPELMLMA